MRSCRTLLALLAFAPFGVGAEIFPLKGDPIKGEIVSVSDKEVVYKQGDKQITRALKEIVKIDYRDLDKPAVGTAFTQVELTDSTVLLASKWSLKKREIELTLLAGPVVKLPLDVVANVLRQAHIEANRRDWKTRVYNTRNRDALVVAREDVISSIQCTLGEGTETGEEITFAVTIDGETKTLKRKLATLHGLIFKHVLPPKAAPPVTCKLLDTLQDVVMVSSLATTATGLSATTPAGAKIDFTTDQVARLDYSKGRFEYLSDLEPIKVVAKSNLDEDDKPDQWHVFKDTNLDGKKLLSLGGVAYSKGLALKPFVELTYDLKGEFREFNVVIGIDDNVSAAGGTFVVFESDGKELSTEKISSEDKKRFKALTLNVKDVHKLKITVKSDDEFDTARHLDLADAKVSK